MSKTTPEEAIALAQKHQIDGIWTGARILALADLIDEARGVDAEPVREMKTSEDYDRIDRYLRNNLGDDDYAKYSASLDAVLADQPRQDESRQGLIDSAKAFIVDVFGAMPSELQQVFINDCITLAAPPAPSQPAAMVNLAAETPTQKGARATLAVQGLSKAFDGLGSGRKDRKMKVTDEMVNRFLMWKLPAGFAPDCGISFKSESDYEHPVFGRSKHEPMGTNLFSADQARAMLEHVLADIQPAAPVELPVVAVNKEWAGKDMSILIHHLRDTNFDAALIGEMLEYAKQAAIAGRKAP